VKIKTEKTFREVSEHYLHEYEIMTPGQRNRRHVENQHRRSRLHLLPFFRNLRRLRARPKCSRSTGLCSGFRLNCTYWPKRDDHLRR
jgi:hypothetical protein